MTHSHLLAPAALKELLVTAARNKDNYLKAKAAFNAKDIAGCITLSHIT
jgi:hypothetical protein